MGRPKKDETTALTKYGKKIISLYVTPEFDAQIKEKAQSKNLTRQAYLITLINADLEKDENTSGDGSK